MPVYAPEEVRAVLKEAKNCSACGLDCCLFKFLKHFPELCTPLCHLFKMSMRQQATPQAWKLARVVPIYKGKEFKSDVSHYKPISLTNIFCKLMEKLVRKHTVEHMLGCKKAKTANIKAFIVLMSLNRYKIFYQKLR